MEKLAGWKRGLLVDHPVDDDPRCRACDGVCCRSFVSVELTFAEYETLRELGAQRLEFSPFGPQRLVIEHGCEFQIGCRCSIYGQRPGICRRFVCWDGAGTGFRPQQKQQDHRR